MAGIAVEDTTLGTAVANLGQDEARLPGPLFHGDTLRVGSDGPELRTSESRPHAGSVSSVHRACGQWGERVTRRRRSGLQLRPPAAPAA